jgi:hypothetical protein
VWPPKSLVPEEFVMDQILCQAAISIEPSQGSFDGMTVTQVAEIYGVAVDVIERILRQT